MDELLIGYLLDALDEPGKKQAEAYLAQHPEAYTRLAVLGQMLAPLAGDRETPLPPPPRLAERTLAKIAEHICTNAEPDDLPRAPRISRSAASSGRSWWRRADLLVAACLMITVTGIALTVLGAMRGPNSAAVAVECKNNLRQFFSALQHYREQHRGFPDVARESPRDVAGMVVPILADAGVLPDTASIRCPGIGSPLMGQLSLGTLRTMSNEEFDKYSPSLSLCYAYSLGYRDPNGAQRAPGDVPTQSWTQMPIMADRPPAEGVPLNSMNHGGEGQNVLFADGHVRFLIQRTFGAGDDIFVNRDGRVNAGLDALDIVLGYSSARP